MYVPDKNDNIIRPGDRVSVKADGQLGVVTGTFNDVFGEPTFVILTVIGRHISRKAGELQKEIKNA